MQSFTHFIRVPPSLNILKFHTIFHHSFINVRDFFIFFVLFKIFIKNITIFQGIF